jgi:hypothetical protein
MTLVAVLPHMHMMGRHLTTTVTLSGTPVVVHDADFDFTEQLFVPLEKPIAMKQGDKIKTDCTFMNDTNETVHWGESSTAEMCLSVFYRFPKTVTCR